jgi:hypothetical protein
MDHWLPKQLGWSAVSDEPLFNSADIFAVLRNQEHLLKKRVQSIPSDTVLTASEHDLAQALVDEFRLDVPVIKEDEIGIEDSRETQVHDPMGRYMHDYPGAQNIPGARTVIAIPFEGDASFFRIQPQTWSSNPPRAEIKNNQILLTFVTTTPDPETIKREYAGALNFIKNALFSLSDSAKRFNDQLAGLAASERKARKERLLANAGMVAAIGLPLKKREGLPTTYTIPVTRKVPKIEKIQIRGAFEPEPVLSQSDYEEILRIMKNMARVMELSPRAFVKMAEETLRSHFLVQLNGAFEGQATGETFNFQG